MTPRVSIVMAVHDGEGFLAAAIDSMLSQTYPDFEFIIVDDGSTDGTSRILNAYGDDRLVIITNSQNKGLARALNRGLLAARGDYIARMDADDIALPERLEMQVAFLDTHLDVGILGCGARLIDDTGRDCGPSCALFTDLAVRWRCLIGNPFQHPTVMLRRQVLSCNRLAYNESLEAAQDYDLWTRTLSVTRGASIAEPLILRRIHPDRISNRRAQLQSDTHNAIAMRTMRDYDPRIAITAESFAELRELIETMRPLGPNADRRRIPHLEYYLNIFETFLDSHRNDLDSDALRRDETLKIAAITLFPPLRPGTTRLLVRLLRLNRLLPFAIMARLCSATARRLSRRLGPTPPECASRQTIAGRDGRPTRT